MDSIDNNAAADQNVIAAARGGGILFTGRLIEYASRFVFGIIIARVLGAEGFGLYTLAITTAILLASLSRLGLSEGIIHFLPPAIRNRDQSQISGILKFSLSLPVIIALVLALLLYGLSDLLADLLFHDVNAGLGLRWVSIAIPLMAFGRVIMASLRGFKLMRYEVYAESIAFSLTRLVFTLLLVQIGWDLPGALAAYAISWIITDILLIIFLNRTYSIKYIFGEAKFNIRKMLSFSAPVCLTQVISQLRGTFELFFLGMISTLAAVGVYSAAVRIQMVGIMFLAAADMVSKPIISDIFHRGDLVQLGSLYKTLTRWSFLFIIPFFITIILFAEPIMAIFGEEFSSGALVLIIVSIGTLINASTGICSAMIVMTGHSRISLINSLIVISLSVILNLLLIPLWGIIGAAVAAALSMAIISIIRLIEVHNLLGLWPYNIEFIKPLIASLISLSIMYLITQLIPANEKIYIVLLEIIILWATYFSVIFLLGLSAEDRIVINRTKKRLSAAFTW